MFKQQLPRQQTMCHRLFLSLLAGSVFLMPVSSGARASSGPKDKYTFNLTVDTVRLSVTAFDRRAGLVTDLGKGDFTVYENGVKQELQVFEREEVPLRMVVLLDTSSSMSRKMSTAQEAAIRFVQSLGPEDSVKVVGFSHRVRTLIDFTSDLEQAANAIREAEAYGDTCLYNALYISLRELSGPQTRVERRAIVVLSDGDDTRSVVPFEDVRELARKSDVILYSVSIRTPTEDANSERNSKASYELERITTESGGSAFTAVEVKDLAGVYDRIAAELKSQYYLGYVSNVRAKDKWRRIQIHCSRSAVQMRTRAGYYARND